MRKISFKVFMLLSLIVILASKCNGSGVDVIPFDHVAQEVIDNDSLVDYLTTHYLDTNGDIQEITGSETSLMSQVTTKTVSITQDYTDDDVDGDVTIDFKLYYLKLEEGLEIKPTYVDSVHVSYKGMLLDQTVFDQSDFGTWLTMNGVVRGMSKGLEEFNSGNWFTNPDSSIGFTDVGKGIVFMPSGLGYGNIYQSEIPNNSPLIFFVNVNLVKQTDWDRDGILSIYEDVDSDGDFSNDDTDGDSYVNYVDADDDGDGVLTSEENADPNDDGNPADALDSDGDTIPDYLDADS